MYKEGHNNVLKLKSSYTTHINLSHYIKIISSIMVSEGLCLLIHRYETERGMRLTVEADLQGLSKVYDDLTLNKTDLEMQIEELNKDLVLLKKEHQEVKNK